MGPIGQSRYAAVVSAGAESRLALSLGCSADSGNGDASAFVCCNGDVSSEASCDNGAPVCRSGRLFTARQASVVCQYGYRLDTGPYPYDARESATDTMDADAPEADASDATVSD